MQARTQGTAALIHATALIDPAARISESAEIGPGCIIGAEVEVGPRTRLMANIYCEGPTWIGADNTFFPYTTVGVAPQDKKYLGERAETRIGDRNSVREFVTIHRGTEGGGLLTRIGDDNLLMAYVHVAHDCLVGSHAILANAVTLAGHVEVHDWASVGAFSGIHQFCRVGRHSFIGGYSVVTQDVMPYSTTVADRDIGVFGANRVGLERRRISNEVIENLQTAFRFLTRAGLNTTQACARIREELPESPELAELLEFIASSKRGVIKGKG
ncbi:MAG: acyl-ACP--UDP-N-acetylglucosamine O-acyltransferase [Acidobacteriota bacterium]|nr:acyl-ACP--UDP-N-acetylglucosamine O-acyltransferase [Acidobacteriota bacterium]